MRESPTTGLMIIILGLLAGLALFMASQRIDWLERFLALVGGLFVGSGGVLLFGLWLQSMWDKVDPEK